MYFVEDKLSIERYKAFQRMEIELAFTGSFSKFVGNIREAYDLLNQSKLADASVLLMNILEGSILMQEKKGLALWVATLFINRTDEDRTIWNQPMAEEKLNHWADIESGFFLVIALSQVRDFSKNLEEIAELVESVRSVRDRMTNEMDQDYPFSAT